VAFLIVDRLRQRRAPFVCNGNRTFAVDSFVPPFLFFIFLGAKGKEVFRSPTATLNRLTQRQESPRRYNALVEPGSAQPPREPSPSENRPGLSVELLPGRKGDLSRVRDILSEQWPCVIVLNAILRIPRLDERVAPVQLDKNKSRLSAQASPLIPFSGQHRALLVRRAAISVAASSRRRSA